MIISDKPTSDRLLLEYKTAKEQNLSKIQIEDWQLFIEVETALSGNFEQIEQDENIEVALVALPFPSATLLEFQDGRKLLLVSSDIPLPKQIEEVRKLATSSVNIFDVVRGAK